MTVKRVLVWSPGSLGYRVRYLCEKHLREAQQGDSDVVVQRRIALPCDVCCEGKGGEKQCFHGGS